MPTLVEGLYAEGVESMKQDDLEKRVDELERRVKELESRPLYRYPVYIPIYRQPTTYQPTPYDPNIYPSSPYYPNTAGGNYP